MTAGPCDPLSLQLPSPWSSWALGPPAHSPTRETGSEWQSPLLCALSRGGLNFEGASIAHQSESHIFPALLFFFFYFLTNVNVRQRADGLVLILGCNC